MLLKSIIELFNSEIYKCENRSSFNYVFEFDSNVTTFFCSWLYIYKFKNVVDKDLINICKKKFLNDLALNIVISEEKNTFFCSRRSPRWWPWRSHGLRDCSQRGPQVRSHSWWTFPWSSWNHQGFGQKTGKKQVCQCSVKQLINHFWSLSIILCVFTRFFYSIDRFSS